MITDTDPTTDSGGSRASLPRPWSIPRLTLDAAILGLCAAVIWALTARSLLLLAFAVGACVVGAAAGLSRFESTPRWAVASAFTCSALALSVLLSSDRVWVPNALVSGIFILCASSGLLVFSSDRRRGWPIISPIVAVALALGPGWAIWSGDNDASTATALRLMAVAVAAVVLLTASRTYRSTTLSVSFAVAASLGFDRLDVRPIELIAVAVFGLLMIEQSWRPIQMLRGPIVPGRAPKASMRGSTAVAVSVLTAGAWCSALIESWHSVLIFASGGYLVAAVAFASWPEMAWESRRRVRSLERIADDIARRSQLDTLTGLPNREALDRRLTEEIERAVRYQQPLALCFVDIDHFKSVNDTYGHAVGDEVLVSVAYALRSTSRTIDIVARYGGEEFVVIAPGTWSSDGVVLAERLRRRVAELRPASLASPVTVSVGVAGLPEHASDAESLLRRADEALYRAKRIGRDRTSVARAMAVTVPG